MRERRDSAYIFFNSFGNFTQYGMKEYYSKEFKGNENEENIKELMI